MSLICDFLFLLFSVLRLPFDVDLMNWGEMLEPRKVIVDSEKLRFWGASASRDDEVMVVPGSDANLRSIEFTGKKKEIRHTK